MTEVPEMLEDEHHCKVVVPPVGAGLPYLRVTCIVSIVGHAYL